MNDSAKWIWIDTLSNSEQYVKFLSSFNLESDDFSTLLHISAETDYIVYLNGERIEFGQFAGWRDIKYFDEIDLTKYCLLGINYLEILVRYEGLNTFTHIDDGAGLIFCVENNGNVLCVSNKEIKCCLDSSFVQGEKRVVTWQLGYASHLVSNGQINDYNYNSKEVHKNCKLLKRTWQRPQIVKKVKANLINKDNLIYDLDKESAGFIYLTVNTKTDCSVKIAYGEHLDNGAIRRIIEDRDFSLDFECKKGINKFEQLFTRVAGRYLQVICEKEVDVIDLGILQTYVPITVKEHNYIGLDKKIYDTSVETLRLCMHHHYEDCPWREQALYVLDSRNQMLCGYYAFKEFEYQRANLLFMSKGLRVDGMLPICFPSEGYRPIPFFAIMYPVSVVEYIENTGDVSILKEVLPAIKSIVQTFINKIGDNGLIENFSADKYWNFYEWTDGLVNYDADRQSEKCDLIINLGLLYVIMRCKKYVDFNFDCDKFRNAIHEYFYDKEKGLYFSSNKDRDHYSALGNSFAVLVGLGDKRLFEQLKNGKNLLPATLSMKCFVYDALLKIDLANANYILCDIRSTYKKMLEKGATSFWETEKGADDFNGAGSLCHGWSAIPVYYFRKLIKN